jgi:hypothetical protein
VVVENTKPPTANAVTRTPSSGPSGPGDPLEPESRGFGLIEQAHRRR